MTEQPRPLIPGETWITHIEGVDLLTSASPGSAALWCTLCTWTSQLH